MTRRRKAARSAINITHQSYVDIKAKSGSSLAYFATPLSTIASAAMKVASITGAIGMTTYEIFCKTTSIMFSMRAATSIADMITAGLAAGFLEAVDPNHKERLDGKKVEALITSSANTSDMINDVTPPVVIEVQEAYSKAYKKIKTKDEQLSSKHSLSGGIALPKDTGRNTLLRKVTRDRVLKSDMSPAKTILAMATATEAGVYSAHYFIVKNWMFLGAAVGAQIGKLYLHLTHQDTQSNNHDLKRNLQTMQSFATTVIEPCAKVALLGCYSAYQLRSYIAASFMLSETPDLAAVGLITHMMSIYPIVAVIGYGDGFSKPLLTPQQIKVEGQQITMDAGVLNISSNRDSITSIMHSSKESHSTSYGIYQDVIQSYEYQIRELQKLDVILIKKGVAGALELTPSLAKDYKKLAIRDAMLKIFGQNANVIEAIDVLHSMAGAVSVTASKQIYTLAEKLGEHTYKYIARGGASSEQSSTNSIRH